MPTYPYYPSWRYHRTFPPRLVQTPDESRALGPEWVDTPARFLEPPPVEAPVTEPAVIVTEDAVMPESPAPAPNDPPRRKRGRPRKDAVWHG